jgi:hypothetical protein
MATGKNIVALCAPHVALFAPHEQGFGTDDWLAHLAIHLAFLRLAGGAGQTGAAGVAHGR